MSKYSPLPLNINRLTSHYKEVYEKNHRRFCQRFVDTIILNHHEKIIDLFHQHKKDACLFNYGTTDTDMLLWKIRDIIDTFLEWETVKEIINSPELLNALHAFFKELSQSSFL
jgi:hypothetical protein